MQIEIDGSGQTVVRAEGDKELYNDSFNTYTLGAHLSQYTYKMTYELLIARSNFRHVPGDDCLKEPVIYGAQANIQVGSTS